MTAPADLIPGEFVRLCCGLTHMFVLYRGDFEGSAVVRDANGTDYVVDRSRLHVAVEPVVEPDVPAAGETP